MVLKDCSRCMVYTKKGQRLSEARVVHTKNSVTLFFDNYKMNDVRLKSRVDFYDEQVGMVVAVCETIIHRNPSFPEVPEPWMAECNILEVKEILQRQRDIRIKVNLEVPLKSEKYGDFYGTITNLSAGGMYLTTKQPLDKDDVVTFNYSFRALVREFKAAPLWIKRVDGGNYGYGCRFIRLTSGAEASIRSYVYKKQLERQKKIE